MDRLGVGYDRLVNIDETALLLLPLASRGWSRRGEKCKHVGVDKDCVTVTTAVGRFPWETFQSDHFQGDVRKDLEACSRLWSLRDIGVL